MRIDKLYMLVVTFLMVTGSFISCTVDSPSVETDESLSFQLTSRSNNDINDMSVSTYRLVVYSYSDLKKLQTGTFVFQNAQNNLGEEVLTPFPLLDDGSPDYNSSLTESIIRQDGLYNVLVVSPGIKCNDNGSFNFNLADLQNDDKRIYFPETVEYIDFRTYASIKIKQKLLDNRSKIGFRFYKSDEADEFDVSNLQIIGAGSLDETVVMHPQRQQVVANPESALSLSLTDVRTGGDVDSEGNKLYYNTADADLISIVPGVYAPKDSVAKIVNLQSRYLVDTHYLTMKCELKQGNRDAAPIHLNFTQEQPVFKPQNKYIYNIVVKSNYLIMTLDVHNDAININEWEIGGNESSDISNPDHIILGLWKIVQSPDNAGWEVVRIDEQTIG